MSKIMRVFYDNAGLPYKDSALSIHYPILEGGEFVGANNTTDIYFYTENLGDFYFVANCKLPNGALVDKLLVVGADDFGTYYALSLDSELTENKGHLKVALKGYGGDVAIEEESDGETTIVVINGTPIIVATGIVDIAINYAPLVHHISSLTPSEYEQLLGAIGSKLDITKGIYVITDTTISATQFSEGQLVYSKADKLFYRVTSDAYVLEEVDIGSINVGDDTLANRLSSLASDISDLDNNKADKEGPLPLINISLLDSVNNFEYKNEPVILRVPRTQGRNTLYIGKVWQSRMLFQFEFEVVGSEQRYSGTFDYETSMTFGDIFSSTYESDFELANNKVISIDSSSTDTQYPSAKAVYTSEQNLRSVLQTAINQSGHSIDLSIDSNYDMVLKLIDANGNIISQDDIDLPLESIVVSATYYDTYTYDGTTYNKVIVIVLATTSVPTIVPVGDLVSGLVNESTFNSAMALKADKSDTYTKTETNTFLGAKADKEGPLPEINESTSTNVFTFITNNDISGKTIVLTLTGTVGGSYIGAFTQVTPTQYSCEFEKIGSAIRIVVDNISSSMTLNNVFNNNSYRKNYEVVNNKVTSVSASSTDTEYPSAKLLYDQLALKADKVGNLPYYPSITGNENITDILLNNDLIDKPFICSCSSLNTHLYRCLFHFTGTGYYFDFEIEDLINGDRWCNENVMLHLIPFSFILTNYTKKNYEITNNKVTSINSSSTDTEYPSAKCVWNECQNIRAVAEGKCKTFTLSASNFGPSSYITYYDMDGNEIGLGNSSAVSDYISGYNQINNLFNSQENSFQVPHTGQGDVANSYILASCIINGHDRNVIIRLPEDTTNKKIKIGDVFFLIDTQIPDRWYGSPSSFYALESKTNLANYYTKDEVNSLVGALTKNLSINCYAPVGDSTSITGVSIQVKDATNHIIASGTYNGTTLIFTLPLNQTYKIEVLTQSTTIGGITYFAPELESGTDEGTLSTDTIVDYRYSSTSSINSLDAIKQFLALQDIDIATKRLALVRTETNSFSVNITITNPANGTEYTMPLYVLDVEEKTKLVNGVEQTFTGARIGFAYALPDSAPFDQREQVQCDDGETFQSGIYYYTATSSGIGNKAFTPLTEGTDYQVGDSVDTYESTNNVYVFKHAWSNTQYGSGNKSTSSLMQYGCNIYHKSNIHKWLNASGDNWFTPDHLGDTISGSWFESKKGFKDWFKASDLAIIEDNVAYGVYEIDGATLTDNKIYTQFILLSGTEIAGSVNSNEGSVFDYWKYLNGGVISNSANSNRTACKITNITSKQTFWLRSPYRGYSYFAWTVGYNGGVAYNYAYLTFTFLPSFTI